MTFQGLDEQQAEAVWQPLLRLGEVAAGGFLVSARAANHRRPGAASLGSGLPQGQRAAGDPVGRPAGRVAGQRVLVGQSGEAGHVLYGFQSVWLPASLLEASRQQASPIRYLPPPSFDPIELHFQKGLAGASDEVIAATRRHRDQPRRARCLRARDHCQRGPAGLSRACRPRARRRRRAQGMPPRSITRCATLKMLAPECGLLCRGKQLLRAALAGRLLGRQLSEAARS